MRRCTNKRVVAHGVSLHSSSVRLCPQSFSLTGGHAEGAYGGEQHDDDSHQNLLEMLQQGGEHGDEDNMEQDEDGQTSGAPAQASSAAASSAAAAAASRPVPAHALSADMDHMHLAGASQATQLVESSQAEMD